MFHLVRIHLFTGGYAKFGKQLAVPDIQPLGIRNRYSLWDISLVGGQLTSPVAISMGPTIERATISTQGAANIKSSLPEDRQYLTDYVPMSGTVLSAGLTSAVTYHIKKVGSNQIGVSALATVSNESARWYSSYQLALTYAP